MDYSKEARLVRRSLKRVLTGIGCTSGVNNICRTSRGTQALTAPSLNDFADSQNYLRINPRSPSGLSALKRCAKKMTATGDKYSPDREVTPTFLATVGEWIDESTEVFVVLRYLRAAGMKDYAFVRERSEFMSLVDCVSDGTDIIAFRDPQLPIRGKCSAEFIKRVMEQIDDGTEYLFVRMHPEKEGDLRLFGEMGDTHVTLSEDLEEELGEEVALGICPPFIEADNDRMISASKGGIDGPR